MQEIYIWTFSEKFRVFEGIDEECDSNLSKRKLANRVGEWRTPTLKNASEIGQLRPTWDFPATSGFGHLVSERAVDRIGDLLIDSGELLPVEIKDPDVPTQFFLFRCTKVVDCLDMKKSDLTYLPFRPDVVAFIKDSVFIPEKLPSRGLFVVPEKVDGHIYVTEEIKQAVKRHKLRGMVLTKKYFGDEPDWIS